MLVVRGLGSACALRTRNPRSLRHRMWRAGANARPFGSGMSLSFRRTFATSSRTRFVFVDFETTGFSHKRDRIIEIGALALPVASGGSKSRKKKTTDADNHALDSFETLVRPNRRLSSAVTRVTGLTSAMVNDSGVRGFSDCGSEFVAFLNSLTSPGGDAPLYVVAHNGRRFDIPFLCSEFDRHKLHVPVHWQFIDTLHIFRTMFPGIDGGYSLRNLVQQTNVADEMPGNAVDNVHRALYDCHLLMRVTQSLFRHRFHDGDPAEYDLHALADHLSEHVSQYAYQVATQLDPADNASNKSNGKTEAATKKDKDVGEIQVKQDTQAAASQPLPDMLLPKLADFTSDSCTNTRKYDVEQLSPMIQQYVELMKRYPDKVILFRVGDFYEAFMDGAYIVADVTGIVCTSISAGKQIGRVAMSGVPHHSVEKYLKALLSSGCSVVICDQVDEPADEPVKKKWPFKQKKSKKASSTLMRREVTRILTPGTLVDEQFMDSSAVKSYVVHISQTRKTWILAYADISTGEFGVSDVDTTALVSELNRLDPKELLVDDDGDVMSAIDELLRENGHAAHDFRERMTARGMPTGATAKKRFGQFSEQHQTVDKTNYGLTGRQLQSCVAVMDYILEIYPSLQACNLPLMMPVIASMQSVMRIDGIARRNLELVANMRDGMAKNTLAAAIDRTSTAVGKRTLYSWTTQPLSDRVEIELRLDTVEELMHDHVTRERIRKAFHGFADVDRIASRAATGRASPRDIYMLGSSLQRLHDLKSVVQKTNSVLLAPMREGNTVLSNLARKVTSHLHTNALSRTNAFFQQNDFSDGLASASDEKFIIAENIVPELDQLRNSQYIARTSMEAYTEAQREATGIKTLKLGHNRNTGYFLTATKAAVKKGKIPREYVNKQSLTNEVRFGTQELFGMETNLQRARTDAIDLEMRLFQELVRDVAQAAGAIRHLSRQVAQCDILCGFAQVSLEESYTRPVFVEDATHGIMIVNGRHPVVEQAMDAEGGEYQPNSVSLGNATDEAHELILLTGPNASGKSCFLRQTALIQILAQMGCFVPAESVQLSVADAVFTRVGAIDDLASGRSTFVVEMGEVAAILRNASQFSLVLLDEVGRGTSTQEGLAIAHAVAEHLATVVHCKTIFATHYHELNAMEETFKNVGAFSLSAVDYDGHLTFDHLVQRGGTTNSFGIEVAKMSGLPLAVVDRAREVLSN